MAFRYWPSMSFQICQVHLDLSASHITLDKAQALSPAPLPFCPVVLSAKGESLWDMGPWQPRNTSLLFSIGTLGTFPDIPNVWKSEEDTWTVNTNYTTLHPFPCEHFWWRITTSLTGTSVGLRWGGGPPVLAGSPANPGSPLLPGWQQQFAPS